MTLLALLNGIGLALLVAGLV
jgi:hypothetical protein